MANCCLEKTPCGAAELRESQHQDRDPDSLPRCGATATNIGGMLVLFPIPATWSVVEMLLLVVHLPPIEPHGPGQEGADRGGGDITNDKIGDPGLSAA